MNDKITKFSNKIKNPTLLRRIFDVEPRGVEPLYPNGNCGLLTRGGPLNSTEPTYHLQYKKERPSISSDFRDSSESAIATSIIHPPKPMSNRLSTYHSEAKS